jgi:hypothetical protein
MLTNLFNNTIMTLKNAIRFMSLLTLIILGQSAYAQRADLQYYREQDQRGVNVFETPKADTLAYKGFGLRIGGGFALQFQSIDHSNSENNLVDLGSDFNLPTANLNLDAQLHDGVRMHLRTYLSARHHNEAWVKGGYIQIDKLDFIKPGFLEGVMKYATIRVGLDEFNYGDNHFRRSDNAQAIYNPFVENFIMDAFSTEAFGEVTVQHSGFLAVVGLTNGKLNQNVVKAATADNKPSFFGKLGFDKQISNDLRVRLTGSWYINHGTTSGLYLYGGDRAGSRYYKLFNVAADPANGIAAQATDFDGRFNAKFTKLNAFQVNPFIKFKGIEAYGVYEISDGSADVATGKEGKYTQVAGELVYRFGPGERYYVGGRYNTVKGKALDESTEEQQIDRLTVAAGWYLTQNILAKVEYVDQEYKGSWTGSPANSRFNGGKFDGITFEAVISF